MRDLVEDAGFGDHLAFDFGLVQDLGYYTGLIVEAFAPGVGLPLATGGRYDGLLARFDWDIPGVGFAVAVDRAADALDEAGVELGRRAGRDPLRRRPRGAGAGGGAAPRRAGRRGPPGGRHRGRAAAAGAARRRRTRCGSPAAARSAAARPTSPRR